MAKKKITVRWDKQWADAHSKEGRSYCRMMAEGLATRFDKRFLLLGLWEYACQFFVDIDMHEDLMSQWLLMTLRGISRDDGMAEALEYSFDPYDPERDKPVELPSAAPAAPAAPPDAKPAEPRRETHIEQRAAVGGAEGEALRTSSAKQDARDAGVQKTLDAIDALVGCDDFKQLAHEIAAIAQEIIKRRTYDAFKSQRYIFSIGGGHGLTTYLEKLAAIIDASKLARIDKNDPVLEVAPAQPRSDAEYNPLPMLDNMGLDKYRAENSKVICIDLSAWISKTNSPEFAAILWTVENKLHNHIVVFRVPFVEKNVLAKVKRDISNVTYARELTFAPLSTEDIGSYAERLVRDMGFVMDEDAWPAFYSRIREEKSDGKFYGFRTVKKVVHELLYIKQLANVRNGVDDTRIKRGEIAGLTQESADGMSGMAMLDELVGVEALRDRIKEIVAQIKLSLELSDVEPPCIHMRFVGSPGTGKTTIARILGRVLAENGVLRNGNFYEYHGRSFCGRYIGETAPKTAAMCRDAYGSVLFVDEAYSLYAGDDNTRDFGKEAIDTMIAEMENHRSDMVVIMAGYPNEMETLMKANPGLASRMPYTLEFPNYTREQLADIFMRMARKSFEYDAGFEAAVRDYFTRLPDAFVESKAFGNARFVRNLFERTWAKTAMRRTLNRDASLVMSREDFVHASSEGEFADAALGHGGKKAMGFDVD
ncbi:MAG: AAA family ATPase [Clostridia bacterium]|nr:AAA family ATPase [Clostridia bacterium]